MDLTKVFLFYKYSSSNILRIIKSRRTRWTRHVVRMEEECIQGFGRKNLKEKTHYEDLE
jgi:hypothetical protein